MTNTRLSTVASTAESSAIRDLLRHAQQPSVLSLAGGLPTPTRFPRHDLAEAAGRLIADGVGLQYGPTEGDVTLREWIVDQLARVGVGTSVAQVIVTSGSQQALDLLGRVLVDPGDVVVVGDPAYLGALQALHFHRPRLVAVPVDQYGIDVDVLQERLEDGLRPAFVYTVSNFDNPTGAVLSDARRRRLAELAERYGFLVVDDDPYGAIRLDGEDGVALGSLSDQVVSVRSSSKVVAPGLRVGWLSGPAWVVDACVIAKQAVDLHTSTVSQAVLVDLLARPGWLDEHIAGLVPWYRRGRDAMVAAIRDQLPMAEFSPPDGGMFCWLRIPGLDATAALPSAIDAGVAYVPGAAFAVDRNLADHLRLSYATVDPDDIATAVGRLAAVVASRFVET